MFKSLEDAVVTVIGDHYGLYGRLLDPETRFADLRSDEVDYLEVVMTLEELLGCTLLPLPLNRPQTVGAIIEYCRSAVQRRRQSKEE